MRLSASLALVASASLAVAPSRARAEPPQERPAYDDARASTDRMPPRGWRDPSAGKETWSPGMVVVGTILISLAGTMLPIGTAVALNDGQDCFPDSSGAFVCRPSQNRVIGLGVLLGAAGGLALGIPFVVLGAQKVPIEIPRRAALQVGPTGAALRFDF